MVAQLKNDIPETIHFQDERTTKIYDAVKRARCVVQIGANFDYGECGQLNDGNEPADVKVLIVSEYSEVQDAIRGCLIEIGEVPIVVYLIAYDEVSELLALRAGAADVLHSNMTVRVMAERLMLAQNHVMKVNNFAGQNRANRPNLKSDIKLDPASRIAELGGRKIYLTKTELSLLTALNEHGARPVSRDELVQEVTTDRPRSDVRAFDSHVKRLRQKFVEAGFSRDVIKTVYGAGYCLNLNS